MTAHTIATWPQRHGPSHHSRGPRTNRSTLSTTPLELRRPAHVLRAVRDEIVLVAPYTIRGTSEERRSLEVWRAFSTRLMIVHPQHRLRRAEDAFVELGNRLTMLVGREGYRALLARALHLAAAEFPRLSAVRPASSTPGRLVGLQRDSRRPATRDEAPALAATLAAILCLLDQFLGNDLTHDLVSEVWPWLADYGDLCQP
jgi:hypothetical protein